MHHLCIQYSQTQQCLFTQCAQFLIHLLIKFQKGVKAAAFNLMLFQKLACLLLFFLFRWLLSPTYDIPHLWWLGIRQPSFSSGDYFPLLPWFFMYLFGVWLGRAAAAEKLPAWFYRLRCPFLEKVGSHTLWIYLLHQPLCLGLTLLLVRLLG